LPVSLACAGTHFLCRFDDGSKTINIEATETGRGGFSSQTDEYVRAKHKVPAKALDCGSDLRAVSAREMLGLFLGFRARHFENTRRVAEAEADYLLARHLFPRNRMLYVAQSRLSVQCSVNRFESDEAGHPNGAAEWMVELVRAAPWGLHVSENDRKSKEKCHDSRFDACFQQVLVGGAD